MNGLNISRLGGITRYAAVKVEFGKGFCARGDSL